MMNSAPIQELIKLTGLNQKGRKKGKRGKSKGKRKRYSIRTKKVFLRLILLWFPGNVRGNRREAKAKRTYGCTQSLATTTPLVRKVFEDCFSGQLDQTDKGSSGEISIEKRIPVPLQ